MSVSVIEVFQSGGNFMFLILIVLCLAVAIVLERLFFLYYKYNINAPKLYQQVRSSVLKGDIKGAVRFCDDTPLPAIMRSGLIKAQDQHLKDAVAGGDSTHDEARAAMKGRWLHPKKSMDWYREMKATFAALPDD